MPETPEEKLERVLILAENSESSDAILLAEEVRRLRALVEKVDVMVDRPLVSRVELIVDSQRDRVIYGAYGVATALQDDGTTLKVFLKTAEWNRITGRIERGTEGSL